MNLTKITMKVLVVAGLVLSGCSPSTDDVHQFTTTREGTVTIATSTGGPQILEDPFIFTKIMEIRSDSEDLEAILERPHLMLMGDDGRLYVTDDSRRQVLQFDRDGTFMRTFGRGGSGPGEFQSMQLLEIHDGILAIYDPVLGRTTLCRTSGELIEVFTLPANMPRGYSYTVVMQYYVLEAGRRLVIERKMQPPTHLQFRATMLDSDLDSLWTESTPLLQTSYIVESVPGFSVGITGIIYGPRPAIVFQRGIGLIISPGDRPELLVYSEDGVLVRKVRVDIAPQSVSAEERKRVTDVYDQRIAEAEGASVARIRAQKEALIFSEMKPAWTSMLVDEWGYCWLAVPETDQERRDAGGAKYRVLAPDGRYLGDTRWPTTYANALVSRGHLLVVETNPDTREPIPTVYRITAAVAGFRYPN
jgi:hypothetical protein